MFQEWGTNTLDSTEVAISLTEETWSSTFRHKMIYSVFC